MIRQSALPQRPAAHRVISEPTYTILDSVPADSVISIRGITKSYGTLLAVNDLHLEVAPGETLGFLGLNGAGKTTSIRILLDLLRPTQGHALILGHDCQSDGIQARARIGYL